MNAVSGSKTVKPTRVASFFAGAGGLNANTGGAAGPNDTIGQVQIELVPWEDRPAFAEANDLDGLRGKVQGQRRSLPYGDKARPCR